MAPPSRSPAQRRRIRRIRITGWTALSSLIATAVGFLVWASTPYPEQPEPLRQLYARDDVVVETGPDHIALSPRDGQGAYSGEALLFFPGARVNPHAYATTFADTVATTGLTVVIVRPWWNLAITDPRERDHFDHLAPGATFVAVGGHSMGGVRACELAADPAVERLVLMASYCINDVSSAELSVLSLQGSEDLLIDQDAIASSRSLLPNDHRTIVLPGLSHASFGDYGPQSGDGIPQLSRTEAIEAITTELLNALSARP